MHPLRPLFLALSTVLFLLPGARPAAASPQGESLHKQALGAAKAGSYRKAKKLWEEAYRLDKEPKYLFNLGMIADESDKPLEALRYFERFVKMAPDKEAYRGLSERAKARIAVLSKKVATLELEAHQPGVQVFVDRESVGKGPLKRSLRLAEGEHLVVASLGGHHGQTHRLTLKGGETRQLSIVLAKIKAGKVRYPMPRWLPWTVLGAGGAIALAGIVPMVLQVRTFDEYDKSIDPPLFPEGDLDLKKKAERQWAAGIALFAVGGAVAVAGLVMALLNRPKVTKEKPDKKVTVRPLVGPGSVALRIRY